MSDVAPNDFFRNVSSGLLSFIGEMSFEKSFGAWMIVVDENECYYKLVNRRFYNNNRIDRYSQWSPNALVVNASRTETTFACLIRLQLSIVDIATSFISRNPVQYLTINILLTAAFKHQEAYLRYAEEHKDVHLACTLLCTPRLGGRILGSTFPAGNPMGTKNDIHAVLGASSDQELSLAKLRFFLSALLSSYPTWRTHVSIFDEGEGWSHEVAANYINDVATEKTGWVCYIIREPIFIYVLKLTGCCV